MTCVFERRQKNEKMVVALRSVKTRTAAVSPQWKTQCWQIVFCGKFTVKIVCWQIRISGRICFGTCVRVSKVQVSPFMSNLIVSLISLELSCFMVSFVIICSLWKTYAKFTSALSTGFPGDRPQERKTWMSVTSKNILALVL